MNILLAVLLLVLQPSADQDCSALVSEYGNKDVDAIRLRLERSDNPKEKLEILYRLYPLTADLALLSDLPGRPDVSASSSELALLAALWTWKGDRSGFLMRIPTIRKGIKILDQAKEMDPEDPFVLLVDSQSLIFKPKIVGGSVEKALVGFRHLREKVAKGEACQISIEEVDSWIWYCLFRLDDPEQQTFRAAFLEANPPPLFREFVLSPP